MGQLIDHRLGKERVLRMIDTAPWTGWDRHWLFDRANPHIGYSVGNVRCLVRLALVHKQITPGNGLPFRVDLRLKTTAKRGAIKVVLHIFFARPYQLYGATYLFGNFSCLYNGVVKRTTAKTTTHQIIVDNDVFGGNT